jgi:hypothetical protein
MNIVEKMWKNVDDVIAAHDEFNKNKIYPARGIAYNIFKMLKAGVKVIIAEIKLCAIDVVIVLGGYHV